MPVTLASVLDAGLLIADTEGLDALTMRRLAAELEVGAMTPYGYVRTKEELIDGIAALILSDLPTRDTPADPWETRLELVVDDLHTALRDHPGVAQIITQRRVPIPALDPFRETLLQILDEAGFAAATAVQIVASLTSFAAGFAAIEHGRAQNDPSAEAARLRALPRDDFPRLAASADAYAGHISQDTFALGLRSFIRGLQTVGREA